MIQLYKDEFVEEVPFSGPIPVAKFIYSQACMMGFHNYLCAVCREKSAIWNMNNGTLHPCMDCEARGYHLVKINNFWGWILRKIGVSE